MNKEAEEVFKAVEDKKITSEEAVTKLVELGYHRADAEELVFIAEGGDDVIEGSA